MSRVHRRMYRGRDRGPRRSLPKHTDPKLFQVVVAGGGRLTLWGRFASRAAADEVAARLRTRGLRCLILASGDRPADDPPATD